MFLREALCRDAELEEDIANLYAGLAARHASSRELAGRWTEMARRERRRARVLQAIVAAQGVAGDDGPFLVHVPLQLAGLRKVVEDARRDAGDSIAPLPAVELVERIEAADRGAIYQSLLELGRPEVVRLLRMLDNHVLPSCSDSANLMKLRDAAVASQSVTP
ncbi:MAG: hypothetical protein HY899_04690 [Deltaproteobacteria bacterium]|nr:hypothetical protein [Deltaproteobacteria bacterium]